MFLKEKTKHILVELKGHMPFTLFGAGAGLLFMLVFRNIGAGAGHTLFAIFHPTHVLLSAMVTASLFAIHKEKKNIIVVLLIGYFGSIGIATLSDSVIPHIGEKLVGMHISHSHEEAGHEDEHDEGLYLGFLEDWYIVNPAALLGALLAYFWPHTKFSHAGHVLLSTWASSSYILMSNASELSILFVLGIFIVLFIAVWLPCCISDIVFPLLFVKSDVKLEGFCPVHKLHSHEHKD